MFHSIKRFKRRQACLLRSGSPDPLYRTRYQLQEKLFLNQNDWTSFRNIANEWKELEQINVMQESYVILVEAFTSIMIPRLTTSVAKWHSQCKWMNAQKLRTWVGPSPHQYQTTSLLTPIAQINTNTVHFFIIHSVPFLFRRVMVTRIHILLCDCNILLLGHVFFHKSTCSFEFLFCIFCEYWRMMFSLMGNTIQ